MAERRVFLCSGKPPFRWYVSNNVGHVNPHYNKKGLPSLKCAYFVPNRVGICKLICYDRRGFRAETSLVRVFPYDKNTAKNAYAGIFIGTEVRKQLGKTVIFRMRDGKQQKYPYHTPSNPRLPGKQQPWRYIFASAMASALALPPEEKEKWRLENRRFTWFNNYIKHYLKGIPKPW
jgi:hypothetical protein